MSQARYAERLSVGPRGWALLTFALIVTVLVIDVRLVTMVAAAWVVNLIRYRDATVIVTDDRVWVGRRSAPLAAFDLATLGRAANPWPWRVLDRRWLGANPIWTRDSVGLRGAWEGRPVWLAVGTNHRDDLVSALVSGVHRAQAGAAATGAATVGGAASPGPAAWAPPTPSAVPPGWYADPWNPAVALRWWDGETWTPHVATRPSARSTR